MPTPGHSSNTRTDLLNALVALEGLTRESILAASDAEQPFAAGAEPERCCEACCLKGAELRAGVGRSPLVTIVIRRSNFPWLALLTG